MLQRQKYPENEDKSPKIALNPLNSLKNGEILSKITSFHDVCTSKKTRYSQKTDKNEAR